MLIATGSLLGEGFDSPALDTMFLAFPLSFKGRMVQYVGRVLRAHDDKHDLEVHDYVDTLSPVLKAMHAKRLLSYAALGFDIGEQRRRRRRIVHQSKSETCVADDFFDVEGVGALVAPIVGVGAVAGSARPAAHRLTRSLASRIPSFRASDQSSTAIC